VDLARRLIPVDLHCHSTCSDGGHNVTDLISMVHANGGKHIALTDHDTVCGVAQARQHALALGLHFIGGVEVSVTWRKDILIHVVGLNVNENNINLVEFLDNLRGKRLERGKRIAEGLASIGVQNAFEGALSYASSPESLSRTHFARFLVDNGYAKKSRVFDKYLTKGKPGYVLQEWASLKDTVEMITQSGGIAVIAHPCRYRFTNAKLEELIREFKFYGGMAIEVVSSSHSDKEIIDIAQTARKNQLLASVGSDFHKDGESYLNIKVGLNRPLPVGVEPIYSYLGIDL
jgi:3',5'-nucleoside bisphosphate phosphatase